MNTVMAACQGLTVPPKRNRRPGVHYTSCKNILSWCIATLRIELKYCILALQLIFVCMMRLTMSASAVYWVVATCVLVITLSPRHVHSQIPEVCANARSLQSMECCPSNCSRASGRGMCVDVEPLPDMMSDDVRSNWPHYFQRICQCHDNYAGYDCSRCKYGYYGPDCGMKQVLPRRNILKLSVQDFTEYIEILQMTRSYNSGYVAVLDQFRPGSTSIETVPVTLYQIFIWLHHFAAKDSECEGIYGWEVKGNLHVAQFIDMLFLY